MGMSLLKALRLNARRVPQRTALRFRDTRLSYAELLQATERAMCALAALGIAPGEKVPLLSFNHPDMLVAYFALTGLGAVPAPLSPEEFAGFLRSEIATLREVVAAARIRAD